MVDCCACAMFLSMHHDPAQLLRKAMKADLGFTPTGFYPSFESKLSNQLLTYTNYESQRFGPCNEPEGEEDDHK